MSLGYANKILGAGQDREHYRDWEEALLVMLGDSGVAPIIAEEIRARAVTRLAELSKLGQISYVIYITNCPGFEETEGEPIYGTSFSTERIGPHELSFLLTGELVIKLNHFNN
jgi:hypothetical protein